MAGKKAIHLKPWYAAVALLAVVVSIALMLAGGLISPIVKRKLISTLRETYQSEIEMQALSVSLFPHPSATGDGLVFRLHGRTDIPPLIKLKHFDASTGWLNALRGHVGSVQLQGLEVRISHKDHDPDHAGDSDTSKTSKRDSPVIVDTIVADGSLVQMLPRDPGKEPLNFNVYKLTMTRVAIDRPAHYEAQLRNAKPPGLISVAGDFGPWNGGQPGKTALTGKFQFSNADLGVFKGIAGRLASTGEFKGVLDQIEVSGETDTPDFVVNAGNHAVDLKTTYRATVDGTDGDTLLHPVMARFGQTTVTAVGGVTGQPNVKGKTVSLDSSVDRGNLGDVLRLAVKGETPIEGDVSFRAKIVIPPGDRDIAEKLQINGQFGINHATFTSEAIEKKVATLSERGQGDTESGGQTHPQSDLRGKFVLADGIIRLTGLSFAVPGAQIRLNGTYGLLTERMDFQGTATMDVKLSKMTTGVKSLFLKALDPIFSKTKKGAVIPIHIGGTRKNPSVGLNIKP